VTDKDIGLRCPDGNGFVPKCTRFAEAGYLRGATRKFLAEFVGKRRSDVIADRVLEGLINPTNYSDFAPDRAYEVGTS
jgi:hypothetical protein